MVESGLLTAVASPVVGHSPKAHRLILLVVVQGLSFPLTQHVDLPGGGTEPMSPELAGRFLTTGPPGSPCILSSCYHLPLLVTIN